MICRHSPIEQARLRVHSYSVGGTEVRVEKTENVMLDAEYIDRLSGC